MLRARNLKSEEKLEDALSQTGETYVMCVVVSILAMAFSWTVTTFREVATLTNKGLRKLLKDLQPYWQPGMYDSACVKLARKINWEEDENTGGTMDKEDYWWCSTEEAIDMNQNTGDQQRKMLEVSALRGTYNTRPNDRWNEEELLGAHYGGRTGRTESLEMPFDVWQFGPNTSGREEEAALEAWQYEVRWAKKSFTWGVWLTTEMMELFTPRNRFNWMKLCWELKQHVILTIKGAEGQLLKDQNYVGTAIKCWQWWLEHFELKEGELIRLQRISSANRKTGYNLCVAWEQSHTCTNEKQCPCLHIGPTSPANEKWRCG